MFYIWHDDDTMARSRAQGHLNVLIEIELDARAVHPIDRFKAILSFVARATVMN